MAMRYVPHTSTAVGHSCTQMQSMCCVRELHHGIEQVIRLRVQIQATMVKHKQRKVSMGNQALSQRQMSNTLCPALRASMHPDYNNGGYDQTW